MLLFDRRDKIRCEFCGIDVHAGISRFKGHLVGASYKGKKNSHKCKKVPEAVSKEMLASFRAYAVNHNITVDEDEEYAVATGNEEEEAEATQTSTQTGRTTAKKEGNNSNLNSKGFNNYCRDA